MTIKDIQNIIKEIIADLAKENYEMVCEKDYGKLLNAGELKESIEDYPGHITLFPDSGFDLMRVYKRSENEYDLDFPLWYENKRSDLTMVCNIKLVANKLRYTIEGILVQ